MKKYASSIRNIFLIPAGLALLYFAGTGFVSYLADRPGSAGIGAFSPNPDCLSDETEAAILIDAASRDDFRKLSPYLRRRSFGGRVVLDYFGGDLRRAGLVVVSAQKHSAQPSSQQFLSVFRPGTGMQEILDNAVKSAEIMEFSGGLRLGSGRVMFLGVPSFFSVKAGAGGILSSFILKIERNNRDSDLPALEALKLHFGESREPYLKETSENISGKLGGMSNTYRNYDCAWELPDYSVHFKASYTHNQNYSVRVGSKTDTDINEAFYFAGDLTLSAKAPEPTREK